MKIKILKSASKDLEEGFYFYEFQYKGLGTYFLESLTSDIESLKLYAGVMDYSFTARQTGHNLKSFIIFSLNSHEFYTFNHVFSISSLIFITKNGMSFV